MRIPILACSLLLHAVPALAVAADAPASKPSHRSEATLDAHVSVAAGAFDGDGVRTDSGGLGVVDVSLDPALRTGAWKLTLPLDLRHTQTFGADLNETLWGARADAEYRASRGVRLGLDAGLTGAIRPDWPDLYQRQPDGTLLPTDRNGYLSVRAGARVVLSPAAHQQLRLGYRFVSYDYVDDPSFEPDVDPNHLTPRDNVQHQLELSWRYREKAYDVAVGVDYAYREDQDLLARNARTGGTSFGTNPDQRLHVAEPSIALGLEPWDGRVDLTLRYGYLVQNDPFAGYYSSTGHHPRVDAKVGLTSRLSATARVEAWLREYTSDGTSAARLDSGTVRNDRRALVRGGLQYALTDAFGLFCSAEWVKRTTNYPDYTPDPLTGAGYDIGWDYTNVKGLAGVEWRL